MTEIERIKQEGWLPENFWNEEVRCEYLVSAEMKKVWAIEMDLYREVTRVLNKFNLRYFTDGGTTLGGVRHKGFPGTTISTFAFLVKTTKSCTSWQENSKVPIFCNRQSRILNTATLSCVCATPTHPWW